MGRVGGKVTRQEAEAHGHRKRNLLHAIREKCLDCCVQQIAEVHRCQVFDCALWPYRKRNNPFFNSSSSKGRKMPRPPGQKKTPPQD